MEHYIDETLTSVCAQKYPNLELIVIDGGSTDKTLEKVDRWRAQITHLISEPDEGQYFAVNKGLALATGEIVSWLNADDIHFPWTMRMVNEIFLKNKHIKWLSGATSTMTEDGLVKSLGGKGIVKPVRRIATGSFMHLGYGFLQNEGIFWRREMQERCGVVDTEYKLAGDFELWTRFAQYSEVLSVSTPLASFRTREVSRSNALQDFYELEVLKAISKLPHKSLLRLFPKNRTLNQVLRFFAIGRGQMHYYNPILDRFVIRRTWTNMAFYRFAEFLRFAIGAFAMTNEGKALGMGSTKKE